MGLQCIHYTRIVCAAWWNPQADIVGLRNLLWFSRENPGNWINLLVLLTPLGWIAHFVGWSAYATFIINLVALIPLAMVIGKLTEDLALRFGDTVGEAAAICVKLFCLPILQLQCIAMLLNA